jgi:hypothetical protein
MHLSAGQWLLMGLSLCLQVTLLSVLIQRKLYSKAPIFFNFFIFGLATFVVGLVAAPRLSEAHYFYYYWTIEGLGLLLSIGVMYEVFLLILKPYQALLDLGKMLFAWAALFLLLASVITAMATAGPYINKICAGMVQLQRIVELMQCGLLLLFLLFESRLGLSWRSLPMCIGLGTGCYAALDLSMSFLRQHFPARTNELTVANALIGSAVLFAWVVNFLLPEPKRRTAQDFGGRLILQRWNEVLLSTPVLARNNQAALPVESFLPGVERAVERVMARRISN